MPRKKSITVSSIALGLTVAFVLSACAGGAQTLAADAKRVSGGTIVYGHQQEPACVFGGWIEQAYLSYQVIDNLVSLDKNHKVVPWLAQSWKPADDQLSWTFTLKKGVKFTDGSPVNAAAVAYNFDYWLQGGNSTAKVWLEGYYKSAEAIDETTVRINLLKPYPRLADNLTQSYFGIQSQKALTTRSKEENCTAPIGSGAFIVQKWNRGQDIILKRNANYTSPPANAKHSGAAYVDTIDWKFIPDPTTRVATLRSGETNAIYDVPAIDWQGLAGQKYQLLKYVTPGRPQQISFNTAQGPFTDEKVRQAFAYSLDRKQIVQTIGRGVIPYEGNGGVSQTTPGYSQKAADFYSYDPKKAAALLDAAGWNQKDSAGYRVKDGKTL
ncbi:MAG: peptide/nickel transport system substrate-binding protein, partial [Mucilaginibacter sp.]|nr:peptide/nickel transport system substrate-binding protein [Mucilaginibacter sp.]